MIFAPSEFLQTVTQYNWFEPSETDWYYTPNVSTQPPTYYTHSGFYYNSSIIIKYSLTQYKYWLSVKYPNMQMTYSGFNYIPFQCTGISILQGSYCFCPTGYLMRLTGCTNCPTLCLTCDTQQCLTCVANSILSMQVCACAMGYYQSNLVCLNCSPLCSSCTAINVCTGCNANASLVNSECLCNSGYFANGSSVCAQCDSICVTCSGTSTHCNSCPQNQVAIFGQCQHCPVQTQSLNGICQSCQSNCDYCYLTYCTQCSSSYFYQTTECNSKSFLQTGTCVSGCSLGYFQNSLNTCCQCAQQCATCSAYSQCLACASNYVLQDTLCQSQCNSGYFNSSGKCVKCYQNCSSCSAETATACLQCITPFLFYEGQCLTTCPALTSNISNICVQCFLNCASCLGSQQNQCLQCTAGYYLLSNICYQICPYTYFANDVNLTCSSCPANCNVCLTASICINCSSNYYSYNNGCYSSCPLQTYSNYANICLKCDPTCSVCTNGLSTGCTSCQPNLLLSQGSCISTCLNQFYQSSNQCLACDISCLTCSINATNCTSCSNKYLSNNQCLPQCPNNYYGDSSQNICLKCHPSCLNCFGPSQYNCTSCTDTLYNFTCISTCPAGTSLFQNQCFDQNPQQLTCSYQCNGCYLSQYSCLACTANREHNPPLCTCPSGYYDSGVAICVQCDHKCLTCTTSSTTCINCLGNRLTNNCICSAGSYDDFTSINCIQCIVPCLTCAASPSSCLQCRNNRILTGQDCLCQQGYYESNTSFCQTCSVQCSTCKTSSTNCLICTDIRVNPPLCRCPDGYFDNGLQTCAPCPKQCQICNSTGCLVCPNNRIGPNTSGNCDCPIGSISLLPASSFCQDCGIAVPIITFNSLLNQIIVDFQTILQTQLSSCVDILLPSTISTLGNSPTCRINGTQVQIQLGFYATIKVNDILNFKPNSIIGSQSQSPCSQAYSQLISQPLTLPNVLLKQLIPSVTFADLNNQSSCLQSQIQFTQQYYDGMRPLEIKSITQTLPLNDNNQQLLTLLNNINSQTNLVSPIIIPANTLSHRTTYEFTLQLTNFINLNNNQQIKFTTGSTEEVGIQFLNTQVSYYRYLQNSFTIQVTYSNCSQLQNQITNLVAISYLNNTQFSSCVIQGLDSGFSQLFTITIPPFFLQLGLTSLNLQIMLDQTILLQSKSLIFSVIKSPLVIQVLGINQQYGVTQQINLTAKVTNRDFQQSDPPQIYLYSWECQDIVLQSSCLDMQGNEIKFTQTMDQMIPAKSLTPYRAYLLTLTVQYSNITVSLGGSLAITELDLPVLLFTNTQVVNLFDESLITLFYPNINADALSYSAAVVFSFDVQDTFLFYYLSLKYKQWNYFSKIDNVSGGNITLRATVYDPRYYMPSIAQIDYEFNVPPQNCQIRINKNVVIEFSDYLDITINGCTSMNQPLLYRYSIFTNNETFQNDIIMAQDLNRILLSDYSNSSTLSTYLFFNQTDNSSTQTQILMISIQDSLNGITNLTTVIDVKINQMLQVDTFTTYVNSSLTLLSKLYGYSLIGKRLTTLPGLISYKCEVYSILLTYLSLDISISLKSMIQQTASQLSQISGVISIQTLQQANQLNTQIVTMISNSQSTLQHLSYLQNNGGLDSCSYQLQFQTYQLLIYSIQLLSSQIYLLTSLNQSTQNMTILLKSTIQTIQNLSIPNQAPTQAYSLYYQMYVSLQSEKFINQITGNLLEQPRTFGSNRNRILGVTEQTQIYQYSSNTFYNNPYYSDESFPKNSSNFSCIDIALQNAQSSLPQSIQQNITVKIPLKSNSSNNLKCISKVENLWQTNICTSKVVNMSVSCNCQQLSPLSLMRALDNIAESTEKSFTSDAVNALVSFSFQETIIFYLYILMTLAYIGCLYKGYLWDKLKINQNINNRINTKVKDYEDGEQQLKVQQNQKDDEMFIKSNIIEDIKDEDIPKQPAYSIYKKIKLPVTPIQKDLVQISSEELHLKNSKVYPILDSMSMQSTQRHINHEQKASLSKFKAFFIFTKQFHSLLSIIFKFDPSLSRPVRATIYYISILGMLSSTFMFGQQNNISINIMVGLILAPMTKIFSLIFEKLLSSQNAILKYLGISLMFSVSGLWSYILLTQIALLKNVTTVNSMTVNFAITWFFDTLIYGPMQLALQFLVQAYIIQQPLLKALLDKLLDEESVKFITEFRNAI